LFAWLFHIFNEADYLGYYLFNGEVVSIHANIGVFAGVRQAALFFSVFRLSPG
jgi:hypothetical protein